MQHALVEEFLTALFFGESFQKIQDTSFYTTGVGDTLKRHIGYFASNRAILSFLGIALKYLIGHYILSLQPRHHQVIIIQYN
jgi:hypothetical protein